MWTLSGPFDGEVGDVSFQKSKLLMTGKTYGLGRKDCPLIVANKKVSSHHCDFVVKDFSTNSAGDPSVRPTLEYVNTKDKPTRILRGDQQKHVNPRETQELQDGDVVAVFSGVSIKVQWIPVCCYVQPVMGKSPVSLSICASLGIHILHVPDSRVTHHLIPSYTAQPIIAASLLSACHFAKLEWLKEIIRLGTLPKSTDPSQGVSLEHTFNLPPLSKYSPTYSPSLSISQKEFKVWEPNEERLMMLAPYRFLYVDEKPRMGDYKEVIERGGGSFETFDVSSGKLKFHRALSRGQAKEDKKQIVIGKENAVIAAIGKDEWKELAQEANSFGLSIHDPEVIVQVVIDLNVSLFDAPPNEGVDVEDALQTTSLPDFIPNTHLEEPSIAPAETEQRTAPSRRLVRRATSRQQSQEPTSIPANKTLEPEEPPEMPLQRKPGLKRRVNAGVPMVIGLDDPSSIFDSTPDLSAPASPPQVQSVDLTVPTPVRPGKLKRRLGGGASESLASQALGFTMEEPAEEPPLKKFKALFDASNPDNMDSGTFDDNAFDDMPQTVQGGSSQTQTQSQTQTKPRSMRTGITANLSTLQEEEEETQTSTTEARGTKRTLDDVDDFEMADGQSHADAAHMITKKQAIESVNAVEKVAGPTKPTSTRVTSKPPSTTVHKGGAEPGKPDQDARFLKAIASTKKGKKGEDDFDRDFNKLKISKPSLVQEEPEEQWAVVADFGEDINIRGNFMVIVEMPAYNRRRAENPDEAVPEWEGKPNFKKFKKKRDVTRKARVDVFISDDNDYGMGSTYWKGGKPQTQTQGDPNPTQQQADVEMDAPLITQTFIRSQAVMVIKDSDEEDVPRKGRSKASSRAGSAAPPRRATTRAKTPAKAQPLFYESDQDNNMQDLDADGDPAESDEEQTLRSTRTRGTQKATKATRAANKKPVPILDDDSDDGAVFKGFKGRRR